MLAYQGATCPGQLWAPLCGKPPSGSPVGFFNLARLPFGCNSGWSLITSHHPSGCYPELHPRLLGELSLLIQHSPASSTGSMTHLTSSLIKISVALHGNGMAFMENVADFLAGSRNILAGIE